MPFSSSAYVTDEEQGTFVQQTKGIELKSHAGKEILEGYLTTKGVDKEGDIFTEDALKKIAERVRDDVDTVDVVFPEADVEDFKEAAEDATTGNIDHNNFPGFRFADSRIVPAFKIVDAEYDGHGVAIKAVLNSNGMLPETVDAVKNAIKEGFLNAFSIEFKIPRGATERDRRDGELVRLIKDARPVGAALTGRPANPRARITETSLKSLVKGRSDMDTTMTEEQEEASQEETPEEAEEAPEAEESPEQEPEGEESADEGADEEQEASLADDVQELKSLVQSVKESNDELKRENEELREQLEDYETAEEVKSEVGKLREELENLSPEDEPVADDDEERVEETANKSMLERKLDAVGEKGSRQREKYVEKYGDVLADKYDISTEEVENHV